MKFRWATWILAAAVTATAACVVLPPSRAGAVPFRPDDSVSWVVADPDSGRAFVAFTDSDTGQDRWEIVDQSGAALASFEAPHAASYVAATDDGFVVDQPFDAGFTRIRVDGSSSFISVPDVSIMKWPDVRDPTFVEVSGAVDGFWQTLDIDTGQLTPFRPSIVHHEPVALNGIAVSTAMSSDTGASTRVYRFTDAAGAAVDVHTLPSSLRTMRVLDANTVGAAVLRDSGLDFDFVGRDGTVDTVHISNGHDVPAVVTTARPDEVIVVEAVALGSGAELVVHRIRRDGSRSVVAIPTTVTQGRKAVGATIDAERIWLLHGGEWSVVEVPRPVEAPSFTVEKTSRDLPVTGLAPLREGGFAGVQDLPDDFRALEGGFSPDGRFVLGRSLSTGRVSVFDLTSESFTAVDSDVASVGPAQWTATTGGWTAIVRRNSTSVGHLALIRPDGTAAMRPITGSTAIHVLSAGEHPDDVLVVATDPANATRRELRNVFGHEGLIVNAESFDLAPDTTRNAHFIAHHGSGSPLVWWALVSGDLEPVLVDAIPTLPGLTVGDWSEIHVAVDSAAGRGAIVWAERNAESPASSMFVRVAIVDLDDGAVTVTSIGWVDRLDAASLDVLARSSVVTVGWADGTYGYIVDFTADGRWLNSQIALPSDFTSSGGTPVHLVDSPGRQGIYVSNTEIRWALRSSSPSDVRRSGYWMLGATGEVTPFGNATDFGELDGSLDAVDLEPTPAGNGYWIAASSGEVVPFGDALWWGDPAATGALAPGERVAGVSASKSGLGYRVFTDLGNVLVFGDAEHLGDVGHLALSGPVIDAVATESGDGYYLVASDGGVFTFGDAVFLGSVPQVLPGVVLDQPVVGLAPTPDGAGYWLVAADGGVFSFGAPFRGSLPMVLPPGTALDAPVNGMVAYGTGYLLVAGDGGVFAFSDLPFEGSLGGGNVSDIVSIAPLG